MERLVHDIRSALKVEKAIYFSVAERNRQEDLEEEKEKSLIHKMHGQGNGKEKEKKEGKEKKDRKDD